LTSAHQNDLKTQKNINLKQRKKNYQIFSKTLLKRKSKQGLEYDVKASRGVQKNPINL
jgi:hypothetical protein